MSPRSGPRGPKSTPRGAKTAPGAAPEPLQRPQGSLREQDRRPEASREPFWNHFGSIFDPPGHHFQRCSLPFSFDFRVHQKSANTSEPQHACKETPALEKVVGGVGGAFHPRGVIFAPPGVDFPSPREPISHAGEATLFQHFSPDPARRNARSD